MKHIINEKNLFTIPRFIFGTKRYKRIVLFSPHPNDGRLFFINPRKWCEIVVTGRKNTMSLGWFARILIRWERNDVYAMTASKFRFLWYNHENVKITIVRKVVRFIDQPHWNDNVTLEANKFVSLWMEHDFFYAAILLFMSNFLGIFFRVLTQKI